MKITIYKVHLNCNSYQLKETGQYKNPFFRNIILKQKREEKILLNHLSHNLKIVDYL